MNAEEAKKLALEADIVKTEIEQIKALIQKASAKGDFSIQLPSDLHFGTTKWIAENGYTTHYSNGNDFLHW